MPRPRPTGNVGDVRRADDGDDAALARRPFPVTKKPTGAWDDLGRAAKVLDNPDRPLLDDLSHTESFRH
jgi:hypothetical protein